MYGIELIVKLQEINMLYIKKASRITKLFQEKFRVTDGLSNEAIDYMNEFKPKVLQGADIEECFLQDKVAVIGPPVV